MPLPCRYGFRTCLSHLIYTVRPCLIHTCHAAPMPCSDHAVLLKATAQHGRLSTAVLCCGLERNGMVRAWHGRGMASVNQTRSNPLAARRGRGTAWARHAMCESAFSVLFIGYRRSFLALRRSGLDVGHWAPSSAAVKSYTSMLTICLGF